MKLRPATLDDADLLLAWRNDELTRRQSRNTEVVERTGHIAWLSRRVEDGTAPLIAEVNGERVGTVRLDRRPDGVELSWTVAPNHRRNGFGREMVFLALLRVDDTAIAEIKPDNLASQRIAEAVGFKSTGIDPHSGLQRWTRVNCCKKY